MLKSTANLLDHGASQIMSQELVKKSIADKKMRCPECKEAIKSYEKYVDMISSVWDGAGGSKVTLICGNGSCSWRERTEFWKRFIDD
jgi:hypothetical protein